jgi:hypothetical protein
MHLPADFTEDCAESMMDALWMMGFRPEEIRDLGDAQVCHHIRGHCIPVHVHEKQMARLRELPELCALFKESGLDGSAISHDWDIVDWAAAEIRALRGKVAELRDDADKLGADRAGLARRLDEALKERVQAQAEWRTLHHRSGLERGAFLTALAELLERLDKLLESM